MAESAHFAEFPFASNGKNHHFGRVEKWRLLYLARWKVSIRGRFSSHLRAHTRGDGQELGQVRAIPTCVSRSEDKCSLRRGWTPARQKTVSPDPLQPYSEGAYISRPPYFRFFRLGRRNSLIERQKFDISSHWKFIFYTLSALSRSFEFFNSLILL